MYLSIPETVLLWEFMTDILSKPDKFCDVIKWEDEKRLSFRVIDTGRFAQLWGAQKRKPGMTYEKLSRAIRYYYTLGIMKKVSNQKLTYR